LEAQFFLGSCLIWKRLHHEEMTVCSTDDHRFLVCYMNGLIVKNKDGPTIDATPDVSGMLLQVKGLI
jgi:hypothetical protein